MSNPHHLSASQRQIAQLVQQCEIYRHMAKEYNALLNYLIEHHPTSKQKVHPLDASADEPVFEIFSDKMKTLGSFATVKSEISADGKVMTLRRCPPDQQSQAANGESRIIQPG